MGQDIFNIAVGLCGALGGWVLRTLWESVRELQHEDRMLAERISSIDVLVAGQYVRRDAFETQMARMFEKLDRIEDKLTLKADRTSGPPK